MTLLTYFLCVYHYTQFLGLQMPLCSCASKKKKIPTRVSCPTCHSKNNNFLVISRVYLKHCTQDTEQKRIRTQQLTSGFVSSSGCGGTMCLRSNRLNDSNAFCCTCILPKQGVISDTPGRWPAGGGAGCAEPEGMGACCWGYEDWDSRASTAALG